jgi:hypothetical protein
MDLIQTQNPMNKTTTRFLTIGFSMLTVTASLRASEVDDILKELNGGSKKSESSGATTSTENKSLKNTEPTTESSSAPSVRSNSEEPASTPKPKKKAVVRQVAPRQQTPQRPSITVWNPKDKLPKEITGQGVAGNFVIYGTSSEGNLILIAAEDAENPFARQYWVVNKTYAGGQANVLVPMGQRQLVQVPANYPLIFIGRGILPGVYNVQAQ